MTLLKEQKSLAEERIKEAGLEGRIRVHPLDHCGIAAKFKKEFDAFFSVEIIEHVGAKHYNTHFKLVDFALKKKPKTLRSLSPPPPSPNRGSPVTCLELSLLHGSKILRISVYVAWILVQNRGLL